MKKKYTRKQIIEAIAYWRRQLKKMNESNGLYTIVIDGFTDDPGGSYLESVTYRNLSAEDVKKYINLIDGWANGDIVNDPTINEIIDTITKKYNDSMGYDNPDDDPYDPNESGMQLDFDQKKTKCIKWNDSIQNYEFIG